MTDDHKLPGDRAWDQYLLEYQGFVKSAEPEFLARHAFSAGWNARRLFDQLMRKGKP